MKTISVLTGVLFGLAAIFCAYAAYYNSQSSKTDGLARVILVIAIVEIFIAVLLLISEKLFKYTFARSFAWFISVISFIVGILLAIYFLFFTILGNDFDRSWSISLALGLLSAIHFLAFFVINRRVRPFQKVNPIKRNFPSWPTGPA